MTDNQNKEAAPPIELDHHTYVVALAAVYHFVEHRKELADKDSVLAKKASDQAFVQGQLNAYKRIMAWLENTKTLVDSQAVSREEAADAEAVRMDAIVDSLDDLASKPELS